MTLDIDYNLNLDLKSILIHPLRAGPCRPRIPIKIDFYTLQGVLIRQEGVSKSTLFK